MYNNSKIILHIIYTHTYIYIYIYMILYHINTQYIQTYNPYAILLSVSHYS